MEDYDVLDIYGVLVTYMNLLHRQGSNPEGVCVLACEVSKKMLQFKLRQDLKKVERTKNLVALCNQLQDVYPELETLEEDMQFLQEFHFGKIYPMNKKVHVNPIDANKCVFICNNLLRYLAI